MRRRRQRRETPVRIGRADASLLDLVDHVLSKGVVITGDVMLGLADVDLVYLQVSLLLCAADRVLERAPAGRRPRRAGEPPLSLRPAG